MTTPEKSTAPEPEGQEVTLLVDPEAVDHVREVAAAHGVEATVVEQSGFVDPVSVTVILFGGSLAIGAVSGLVEQHKGGQVFDLRPGAPRQAYRSRDVGYGYVLVIAADGTVTVEVKEPKGMFGTVVEALGSATTDLGKASLAAITETAKAAVGDHATVTSQLADAQG